MENSNKDETIKVPENIVDTTEVNQPENQETDTETITEVTEPEVIDYDAKIAELNDRYLRLYSEFDNYRKRTIKEKSDIIRSAGEDVFKAVLPTIDDFERAIKANESVDDINAIKEGILLIYTKLKASCQNKGLEQMDIIGKPFDADIMESITQIPAPTDDMKGKVIDDVEKGYKLGDKVIRFAKVVVGN